MPDHGISRPQRLSGVSSSSKRRLRAASGFETVSFWAPLGFFQSTRSGMPRSFAFRQAYSGNVGGATQPTLPADVVYGRLRRAAPEGEPLEPWNRESNDLRTEKARAGNQAGSAA